MSIFKDLYHVMYVLWVCVCIHMYIYIYVYLLHNVIYTSADTGTDTNVKRKISCVSQHRIDHQLLPFGIPLNKIPTASDCEKS